MTAPQDFSPVAAAVRSGFIEGVHFGAAVVVDPDGAVVWSIGNPDAEVYGRSANKPLQVRAMVDLGLQLNEREVAIAVSSHSGTGEQLAIVREILGDANLGVDALQNQPDLPYDDKIAERWLADGHRRESIAQNCSGKHAAMLATCVTQGWDVYSYLDLDHPLQKAITNGVADYAGGVIHVGIDGCGAPTHVTTLSGLARAFSRLAAEGGAIPDAMRNNPGLVAGDGRPPTELMRAAPGLVAKDGADGVLAGATPDGHGIAVKISGGVERATGVVFARAAQVAGLLADVDPTDFSPPVLGHGQAVGRIEPLI